MQAATVSLFVLVGHISQLFNDVVSCEAEVTKAQQKLSLAFGRLIKSCLPLKRCTADELNDVLERVCGVASESPSATARPQQVKDLSFEALVSAIAGRIAGTKSTRQRYQRAATTVLHLLENGCDVESLPCMGAMSNERCTREFLRSAKGAAWLKAYFIGTGGAPEMGHIKAAAGTGTAASVATQSPLEQPASLPSRAPAQPSAMLPSSSSTPVLEQAGVRAVLEAARQQVHRERAAGGSQVWCKQLLWQVEAPMCMNDLCTSTEELMQWQPQQGLQWRE